MDERGSKFRELRCEVLDAFADLESVVVRFLDEHCPDPGCTTAPLGQKLEKIGTLKPSSRFSKKKKTELSEAIKLFAPALLARADLVHSRQHVVVADEPRAFYINASQQTQSFPSGRALTMDQHHLLIKAAQNLANLLV